MRKHEIPRKKQNETRLFVIFSLRSLVTTVIGIMIGVVLGIIPLMLNFQMGLFILAGIFGLIGFTIGTFPVMYIPGIPITKEVQKKLLNSWSLKTFIEEE